MRNENINKLYVMAWNIGFGSRKKEFIQSDSVRAGKIAEIINKFNIDAIAFQEMANREYEKKIFNLRDYLEKNDEKQNRIHFEPSLSLGGRNGYPYGKLEELNRTFGIIWQEQGPGIWIRNVNGWHLRNLYSDEDFHPANVEVQRPLPHPLYMGEDKSKSAGRDEEDRPVLWSRIDKLNLELNNQKIYFLSLHLPTLKKEEELTPGIITKSQVNIAENVLRLSKSSISDYAIDKLASELRQYYLNHIITQVTRIEEYWEAGSNCIFILAGDFNFYHTNSTYSNKTGEQIILEKNNFKRVKSNGFTRPYEPHDPTKNKQRLIDNIWIKGAVVESIEEIPTDIQELTEISDHYPVIAQIYFN